MTFLVKNFSVGNSYNYSIQILTNNSNLLFFAFHDDGYRIREAQLTSLYENMMRNKYFKMCFQKARNKGIESKYVTIFKNLDH